MPGRLDRIDEFDKFKNNAERIFDALSKSDKSHARLNPLFSLCVCPGGRHGGLDEKRIEVFYGNRPIGEKKTITKDFDVQITLEIAHGATLFYLRTDHGHVVCNLYPAKSENQRPREDFILLDYIKDPAQLEHRAKSHWKMFISYMEATCIDGNPTFTQKCRVFYLKNFKRYVADGITQDRKCWTGLKKLFGAVSAVRKISK